MYQDAKVHVYSWDGAQLGKAGLLEGNKGIVTALAFSPDGSMIASGDVRNHLCRLWSAFVI
jgi:WD repeat-containing protein 1 (actin-interacting protein 1)